MKLVAESQLLILYNLEDKQLKRWLIYVLALLLVFMVLSCCKGENNRKTPTEVIKVFFEKTRSLKAAIKKSKEEGVSNQADRELINARSALEPLFLTPKKGKLLTAPMMLLDLEEIAYIEEKIDGERATVTTEHSVIGFAGKVKLIGEAAKKRKKITFELVNKDGAWLISDLNGILATYGR